MMKLSHQGLYMQTSEIRHCVVHCRRAAAGATTEMERSATGGAGSGRFKPISGRENAPNLQLQPPRAQGADREAKAKSECAFCQEASAKNDEVLTQFYPLLDDQQGQ